MFLLKIKITAIAKLRGTHYNDNTCFLHQGQHDRQNRGIANYPGSA